MADLPFRGGRTIKLLDSPLPSSLNSRTEIVTQDAAAVRSRAGGRRGYQITTREALLAALSRVHFANARFREVSVSDQRARNIATQDQPTTALPAHGSAVARVRDWMVSPSLPFGRSFVLDASGWSDTDIATLTADGPDSMFYVYAQMIEKQWQTMVREDEAQRVVRQMRFFVVAAAGSHFIEAFQSELSHYGAQFFAISKIIITKEPLAGIRGVRAASQARRVAKAAAGFKEVLIEAQTRNHIFFPSTYGVDCFLQIVEHAIHSLTCVDNSAKVHYVRQCLSFLRPKVTKDGITSHAISAFNDYLDDWPLVSTEPIRLRFLKRTVRTQSHNTPGQRQINALTARQKKAPVPTFTFTVLAIDFSGKIASAESEGGLHYVLIKCPLNRVTATDLDNFESTFLDIISNYRATTIHVDPSFNPSSENVRVDYKLIHRCNIEEMQKVEEANSDMKRKRQAERSEHSKRRQLSNEEAQLTQEELETIQREKFQSSTTTVGIYDIESIFYKSSLSDDAIPEEMRNLGVLSSSHSVHRPFMITYATFQLNADSQHMDIPFSRATTAEEIEDIYSAHRFKMVQLVDTDFYSPTHIVNEFLADIAARCKLLNVPHIYLFAHNGSKYDHHLLLKHYQNDERCKLSEILITPRGVLGCTFIYDEIKIDLRCTALFFQESLADLCLSLDIPKIVWKKDFEFDHDTFTPEYFNEMPLAKKEALVEYAEYDIYSLFFIMLRLESFLQRIDPIRPCDVSFTTTQSFKPQCSKMTFQSFIRSLLSKHYFTSEFPPFRILLMDELLLSAMRGGMTQTFTCYFKSPLFDVVNEYLEQGDTYTVQNLVNYIRSHNCEGSLSLDDPDKNSLYPSTMCFNGVPKGQPVLLEGREASTFVHQAYVNGKDHWGVALVKQVQGMSPDVAQCFVPLMSYRTAGGESILYSNADLASIHLGADYFTERLGDISKTFTEKSGWMWATTDHLAIWALGGAVFEVEACFAWSATMTNWSVEYSDFVRAMYEARQANRDNPVIQKVYKLAMNGAFGSSGQKATTSTHYVGQQDLDGTCTIPRKLFATNTISNRYIIGDQFTVYRLESRDGCTAKQISCKSTVTSRILSGSCRSMFDAFYTAAKAVGVPFGEILNNIHYMDTDSAYCNAQLKNALIKTGQIGKDLGQFSSEVGDLILYACFPMPKVYMYKYLTDKGLDEENKPLTVPWELKTSSRFKGLPMTSSKLNHEKERMEKTSVISADEVFTKLMHDGHIKKDKIVWHKGLGEGVTTIATDYEVQPESFTLFSNKIGWTTRVTASGCIEQKWIPHGFNNGVVHPNVHYFSDFEMNAPVILQRMEQERLEAEQHPLYLKAVEEAKQFAWACSALRPMEM